MNRRKISQLQEDSSRLSARVQLDEVVLTSIRFDADASIVSSSYKVETSLRVRGEQVEDGVIVVSTRHESVARSEAEGQSAGWRIVVDHDARFDVIGDLGEITEDELMALAVDTGVQILHPFAREVTHSLTSKSAFPAFTMGRSRSIWEEDSSADVDLSVSLLTEP